MLEALNKLPELLFFLCGLNILRHIYYFVQTLATSTEENPLKYKLSTESLVLLGVSISYVLTALIK